MLFTEQGDNHSGMEKDAIPDAILIHKDVFQA